MAKYRSGQQVRIDFTVPQADGTNDTGLTWTVQVFTKDGTKVTAGTEFASISITEDASNDFYSFLFTPASDSVSYYVVTLKADDTPATVFEENFEPDWAWLMLYGDNEHDTTSPETTTYKKPDGTTLKEFNLARTGNVISRTGA